MRIDLVSLFPEMFASVLSSSILKRAAEVVLLPGTDSTDPKNYRGPAVSYHLHNPRDFADNKHSRVDDSPYGGGPGMVMQCQPIYDCVLSAEAQQPQLPATRIALTPTGRPLTQPMVEELAKQPRLLVLCGHYEGFDQRVLDELSPMEISLGDYVLTGGELPAMVLIDAIIRLIPGVIGKEGSHHFDSFSPGSQRLLDHPHYTRPAVWRGRAVPDVLVSGDHGKVDQWRREQSLQLTRARRPDLLADRWDGRPARHQSDPNATGGTPIPPLPMVIIRDAMPGDHDAIDQLLRASFQTEAEAQLVKSLREQGDAPIELVAEAPPGIPQAEAASAAGRIASNPPNNPPLIAHLLLSSVSIEGGDGRLRALGLAPLTVDPAWQRRGIGKAMVRQGLRVSDYARAGAVFVLGDPAYYGPLGFQTASRYGFTNSFGVDEPFQVHLLRPMTGPAGLVRYAPAFEGL